MKYLLVLSLFVASCASKTESVNTSSEISNTSVEVQEIANPITASNWEDFWQTFQKAAAENDKTQIKELAVFHNSFTEKHFDDNFELFFTDAMFQLIANTKANDLQINDNEIADHKEQRQLTLIETFENGDDSYESALILYFGKNNGKYALVQWMAAG